MRVEAVSSKSSTVVPSASTFEVADEVYYRFRNPNSEAKYLTLYGQALLVEQEIYLEGLTNEYLLIQWVIDARPVQVIIEF